MTYGPDTAAPTSTTQIIRKGAAPMAEFTTLDQAIRQLRETPPVAVTAVPEPGRSHSGSHGTATEFPRASARRNQHGASVRGAQSHRAQPRRPLRIPGR
ncbi:hypothetical protein [Nocardia sp. NPDC050710]|uniref:hypothetical protein n=1 Tax=Nocardia sp. NPDC050710 TaxID=3157220 RepID=UPI0033F55241